MSRECIQGIRIVLTVTMFLLVTINMLPVELAVSLVVEHGPIEMLTVIGYFIAAFGLVVLPFFRPGVRTVLGGFLVLLLGLRELDFHSKFTTMGIFKSRYYLSPDVPLPEKGIVSLLMILLVIVLVYFSRTHFPGFLDGLKKKESVAVNVGLALLFAIGSKGMDSISASLHWIAALYHENPARSMQINEEVIELAIPLFLLCAIYHLAGKRNVEKSIS
ncbi:hypothetical protein [Desulfopila sp. IMCC35008]|uniref:hypothetical protein n=1 Tax=Desulfopila sp. IMCC35008 TaxID=2653858 RepID=UPI0013D24C11|nr:hypothetical protein [Desulfopila sp. IMCC35008]